MRTPDLPEQTTRGVRLELLGPVAVIHTASGSSPLERKAAGLMAYLSLEGPATRSRLAGLLWPDANETTARNNLAQALHRLRRIDGADRAVAGTDVLQLDSGVQCDARGLQEQLGDGRPPDPAAGVPRLITEYDFSDCPDFAQWLNAQRSRVDQLWRKAVIGISDEHESAGDWRPALAWATALFESDATNEDACRRVMRLNYLIGDRSTGLKAYQLCRQTLADDLGVVPTPETEALAALMLKSVPDTPSRARSAMPLTVQRPPRLIGRAAALKAMEEAWDRRQAILLSGSAGIGKTRLSQDFAATRGPSHVCGCRPSDPGVPYSTQSRLCRELLRGYPDIELPQWVQREMGRLLPELGDRPVEDRADPGRLRSLQAHAELLQLAAQRGLQFLRIDDLHFIDRDSWDCLYFACMQQWGHPQGLRTIIGFREEALPDEIRSDLATAISAGLAVNVRLEPLQAAEMRTLLDSLEIELPVAPDALVPYAAGNPLFALELVKSFLDARAMGTTDLESNFPGTVKEVIRRRLDRLSLAALDLVRVAAAAGSRFEPGLAAFVLDRPLLVLADPWAELDRAHILKGSTFTHDIIREAIAESTPVAVRDHLDERIKSYRGPGRAPKRTT
jgi:DNA-binding SARP family transcriptional activator